MLKAKLYLLKQRGSRSQSFPESVAKQISAGVTRSILYVMRRLHYSQDHRTNEKPEMLMRSMDDECLLIFSSMHITEVDHLRKAAEPNTIATCQRYSQYQEEMHRMPEQQKKNKYFVVRERAVPQVLLNIQWLPKRDFWNQRQQQF